MCGYWKLLTFKAVPEPPVPPLHFLRYFIPHLWLRYFFCVRHSALLESPRERRVLCFNTHLKWTPTRIHSSTAWVFMFGTCVFCMLILLVLCYIVSVKNKAVTSVKLAVRRPSVLFIWRSHAYCAGRRSLWQTAHRHLLKHWECLLKSVTFRFLQLDLYLHKAPDWSYIQIFQFLQFDSSEGVDSFPVTCSGSASSNAFHFRSFVVVVFFLFWHGNV